MPDPLVPPDVDLRGTAWMPYFGHLLRGSELNAVVSDAGFRAAHNLWWAAWNEVPAASLPDDDRRLARMADFGANLEGWLKIKDEALHGFVKCSDGRLYHEFLSGVAIHSWEQLGIENLAKSRARDRMRKFRARNRDVLTNDETPPTPPRETRKSKTRAHARENGRISEDDSLGRSAPLNARRKEMLRQKLMRFAQATKPEPEATACFLGLMGEDQQHDAQWWLDNLDRQMRAVNWNG
jgi:hypothetical protein